jgi:hypothetical protein
MRDERGELKGLPHSDLTRSIFFQQAPRAPDVTVENSPIEAPSSAQATSSASESDQD